MFGSKNGGDVEGDDFEIVIIFDPVERGSLMHLDDGARLDVSELEQIEKLPEPLPWCFKIVHAVRLSFWLMRNNIKDAGWIIPGVVFVVVFILYCLMFSFLVR